MDHRPFEDWLLNNETLSAEENRQLNAHLQGCCSCSALAEVNLALKTAKMAEPATGFAERFQMRLEAQKKAVRRRNFWGLLVLTLSVLSGRGPVPGRPGSPQGSARLHSHLYLDSGPAGSRRMEPFMGFVFEKIYQDSARSVIL